MRILEINNNQNKKKHIKCLALLHPEDEGVMKPIQKQMLGQILHKITVKAMFRHHPKRTTTTTTQKKKKKSNGTEVTPTATKRKRKSLMSGIRRSARIKQQETPRTPRNTEKEDEKEQRESASKRQSSSRKSTQKVYNSICQIIQLTQGNDHGTVPKRWNGIEISDKEYQSKYKHQTEVMTILESIECHGLRFNPFTTLPERLWYYWQFWRYQSSLLQTNQKK
ncbi:hypothetical protein RFI_19813 [Reticulomyxa filosa]|uniref:Uncharacterized protein n=1 Tax=Reticulomyxa filosa TaxID=46433 RepID=X6MUL6_RETFI|nr:hypothetical protein RFI_19813 [Reticulomyxa filosa]|eukprot:ETO17509.1 hypothetical protein RFI_19813 [Reticulomyxa filosa]